MLNPQNINARLEIAEILAKDAGDLVHAQRKRSGAEGLKIEQKSPQDFVTDMDKKSEDIIRAGLVREFPTDGFLGEESQGNIQTHATWVVDPIDGTTNFIRGFDHWGVSIALVSDGKVVGGVVYQPATKICYTAALGRGARVNGQPLQRPDSFERSKALAGVGYNHTMDINEHVFLVKALHGLGCDLRNNGSAAMDLINIAEGKIDVSFIHKLSAWDALAGLLIASEAGAVGFCPSVKEFLQTKGPVLCGDATMVSDVKEKLEKNISELRNCTMFNLLAKEVKEP